MKLKTAALSIAAILSLQGCLVFIPGQLIDRVSDGITGAVGEHCVSATAKVGDRVRMPYNGVGVVKELSGTSIKCTNPELPIRALIVADEAVAAATSNRFGGMQSECVPTSTAAGDTVQLDGRAALVKLVYGESYLCKDAARPIRASVVFN